MAEQAAALVSVCLSQLKFRGQRLDAVERSVDGRLVVAQHHAFGEGIGDDLQLHYIDARQDNGGGIDSIPLVRRDFNGDLLDLETVVGFDYTRGDRGEKGGLLRGTEAEHDDDPEAEQYDDPHRPGTDGKRRGGEAAGIAKGMEIQAITDIQRPGGELVEPLQGKIRHVLLLHCSC